MTNFNLYNADCLEKMKDISDKSVDLIICDLPYGCLSNDRKGKRVGALTDPNNPNSNIVIVNKPCSWDIKINLEEFWKQIKRIRKNDHTPCIHFCSTKFGYDLINSNQAEFRYDIVWNKMRGVGFLSANKKPMNAHEMIYVFSKKGANYNRIDIVGGEPYIYHKTNYPCEQYSNIKRAEDTVNTGTRCVISVINQHNKPTDGVKTHPTAKPKEIYQWLIERYSNIGDTVLDPTFGSCNSGIVARALGRNYIGIEKDKTFYDKAVLSTAE